MRIRRKLPDFIDGRMVLMARIHAMEMASTEKSRADWLLNVYRWNGLPQPATEDDLPQYIRDQDAEYEKALVAGRAIVAKHEAWAAER